MWWSGDLHHGLGLASWSGTCIMVWELASWFGDLHCGPGTCIVVWGPIVVGDLYSGLGAHWLAPMPHNPVPHWNFQLCLNLLCC